MLFSEASARKGTGVNEMFLSIGTGGAAVHAEGRIGMADHRLPCPFGRLPHPQGGSWNGSSARAASFPRTTARRRRWPTAAWT